MMVENIRRARLGEPRKLVASDEILSELADLGELQCSIEEIAALFGVTPIQMRGFLRSPRPRRAFEAGQAEGVVGLRRAQFKMAATSAPMAMLLSKAYLGQDERRETDENAPIEQVGAADRLRAKLAAIAAQD